MTTHTPVIPGRQLLLRVLAAAVLVAAWIGIAVTGGPTFGWLDAVPANDQS